jgi:hypothetical protein
MCCLVQHLAASIGVRDVPRRNVHQWHVPLPESVNESPAMGMNSQV